MKRQILITVMIASTMFLFASSSFGAEAQWTFKRKLIEFGWDIPDARYLCEHWREMEKRAPFDGVVYDLDGTTSDGRNVASPDVFTDDVWTRGDFRRAIDDINACEFSQYKNNFIRVIFTPTEGFSWTNDESWRRFSEHIGICAWAAKETGGNLCLDFESYETRIFKYDSGSGLSFDETREAVRKRGAEFAGAAFEEKSDLVLLCLWMNSVNFIYARMPNPEAALRLSDYALLPSFIDGMLDVAPAEAKFIEGCEDGYYMNGREEYQRAALAAKLDSGPGQALVSPENRVKYRAQVSSGFGFYLDMYSNPEGSDYYRGPEPGETRFERLCANLQAAWDASDEYVWVYGEDNRWWAPGVESDWTSWEEALPGITDFILELSNPARAALAVRDRAKNAPGAENLVVNGDFSVVDPAENTVEAWSTWRGENLPGGFQAQKGAVAIKGNPSACYIQSIAIEPGKKYVVSGRFSAPRKSLGTMETRWEDAEGGWFTESGGVTIWPDASVEPDAEGFREAAAIVEAPEKARRLVLLLSADFCNPDETVVFKDVEAYCVN